MNGPERLLGIDWGTSNRRAYLIDAQGRVLSRHADDRGLLAVGADFPASFARLCRTMEVGPEVTTIMSGMVGSAGGWQEAPYLDTAQPLSSIPAALVPLAGHSSVFIVPGYCERRGSIDVMRGEETQLLGAWAMGVWGEGWAVLPGTHSKWVRMHSGRLERIATYMTGELFALLGAGGTLAQLMADSVDDDGAFLAGLDEGRSGQPLSHALFGVRARVVSKAMPASHARSWISGLLIGAEFAGLDHERGSGVSIIASPGLAVRYAQAAIHAGLVPRVLDPDEVYCAALEYILENMNR